MVAGLLCVMLIKEPVLAIVQPKAAEPIADAQAEF